MEFVHYPGADPLVAASLQGGSRAIFVCYLLVGTAEDQNLHELVEDNLLRDAGIMAAEWISVLVFGQQVGELLEDGFDDARWDCGHGLLFVWKASATSRVI